MTRADDTDPAAVEAVWEDLLSDLAATAEEYRDDGWETLAVNPGDVTALGGTHGDRVGIDVLVPDDEYRDLEAWFDAGFAVDDYEVYRSTVGRVVFLLVAVRDETDRRVVLYPAYYAADDNSAVSLVETAREEGELRTFLRRLSGDYVELTHDDPSLFLPATDDETST